MQRFELFLPAGHPLPDDDELAGAVIAAGGTLDGDGAYRPGAWRDPATGARAVLDLGEAPVESDPQHPPRVYEGWMPLHLAIQVPLVCPHWQAVEAFQFIERLLAGLPPATRALDTEDTQERQGGPEGPAAWSRPRALASWARLHAAQVETRTDLARMAHGDSLRLWRWRRERGAGAAGRPDLAWPEATVLRDRATAEAHAVCVWRDTQAPCALPGSGLVLVMLGQPRLVRRSDLPAGEPLAQAGAAAVPPSAAWPEGLPVQRFAACDDDLWVDG